VFGASADADAQAHRDATDPVRKGELATSAEDGARLANIGYIAGGALLATGVGLLLFDALADDAPVAVTPGLGGIDVQVRF
jgi:hypothetical protein